MEFKWMLVYAAVLGLSAADSPTPTDSPICSEPTNPTNFTFSYYIGNKLFVKYYMSNRIDRDVDGITIVFKEDSPNKYNVTARVFSDPNKFWHDFNQWTVNPSKHEVILKKGENVTIYSIPYLDKDSTVLHLCTATYETKRRNFILVLSTSLDFDPTKALEEAKKIPLAGEFLSLPYKNRSVYAGE